MRRSLPLVFVLSTASADHRVRAVVAAVAVVVARTRSPALLGVFSPFSLYSQGSLQVLENEIAGVLLLVCS